MKLSDRIKRWWSPAQWRDEHPEVSEGEDFTPKGNIPKATDAIKPTDATGFLERH